MNKIKKISYKIIDRKTEKLLLEVDNYNALTLLRPYGKDLIESLRKSGTKLVIEEQRMGEENLEKTEIKRISKISEEDGTQVASIAVMTNGEILMGKRNDNEKWTLPGGHSKQGENPIENAIRELEEETGIKAEEEDLTYLGQDTVDAEDTQLIINCFLFNQKEKTNSTHDPDDEVEKWEYIDISDGLPKEILNNLHSNPNITLTLLGLQETKETKEGMKKKSGIGDMFRGEISGATVTKFKNMFLRLTEKQQKETIQNLEALIKSGAVRQVWYLEEMLDIANTIYNLNKNKPMDKLNKIKEIKAEINNLVNIDTTKEAGWKDRMTHWIDKGKEVGNRLRFWSGDKIKNLRTGEIETITGVNWTGDRGSAGYFSTNIGANVYNIKDEGKTFEKVSSKNNKNGMDKLNRIKEIKAEVSKIMEEETKEGGTITTKNQPTPNTNLSKKSAFEDTSVMPDAGDNPIFQIGEPVMYQGKHANVFDYEDGEYTITIEEGNFEQVTVPEQELVAENQGASTDTLQTSL